MNTRNLKHFLGLIDILHFGRASNISISALYRNTRQLEDKLGALMLCAITAVLA